MFASATLTESVELAYAGLGFFQVEFHRGCSTGQHNANSYQVLDFRR